MSRIVMILVLGLISQGVIADLPVHCVKHSIVGSWRLSLTEPQISGPGMLPCGHEIPDREETSLDAGQNYFKESLNISVELENDDTVKGPDSSSVGKWTMVYDEGFEINYKSVKYFAFSKYAKKSKHDFDSLCGETLIGWYNNLETGDRGCYRAVKVDGSVEPTQSLDMISVVQPEFTETKNEQKDFDLDSYLDLPIMAEVAPSDRIHLHKEFSDHDEVVENLNKVPSNIPIPQNVKKSWTARVNPEFKGKSILELNQMAGRRKYHQKQREVFAQIKSHTRSYTSSTTGFPNNFSWEQYLAEPRQQQRCGSCYAIATMSMLSMRLKMKGENVDLSPQYSVDCNYYNQGCDGGYPFLVEKFFTENYLVSENDYPYTAKTGRCQNVNLDNAEQLYQIKNYRYIGGAYGLSNEQDIMEEIYNNGPVILNFEPEYDFMSYGGGVYHSTDAADWKRNGYSQPEWEKVDHSVLCYGWGEDNGDKYWMLQNSWGPQWGENGNFSLRMRRGTDESAIESMAEAADPIVVTQNKRRSSFLENPPLSNQLPLHYSFLQQQQKLRNSE